MSVADFKEGDVVMLASGGPHMTVVGESNQHPGKVWCVWFDDKKQHQGRPFAPATLVKVESRPQQEGGR